MEIYNIGQNVNLRMMPVWIKTHPELDLPAVPHARTEAPVNRPVGEPRMIEILILNLIRVRDSRTGYLVPVRDALWDLPGWKCCWDVVVAAAAVAAVAPLRKSQILISKILFLKQ